MRKTSLGEALFTKTQRRVLGLLFGNPGRSYYANEIVRYAGAGIGAVQRELAHLESARLVTVSRLGNQKHYQANREAPIFDELRGIAVKTLGVVPALQEPRARYAAQRPGGRMTVPRERLARLCRKYGVKKLSLFGSAARDTMTPDSDVDVLVEFSPGSTTSLFDLPAMQDELSALFGYRKVDIATPEILDNPFRRKAILPELRTLYAA